MVSRGFAVAVVAVASVITYWSFTYEDGDKPLPKPAEMDPFIVEGTDYKTYHIVAHSHQDAGWGLPAKEYFSGVVFEILNTVS